MLNPTPNTNRLLKWMAATTAPQVEKSGQGKEKPAKSEKKANAGFSKDVLAFQRRDFNQDGFLSTKEYGKGQKKQDEFRRYDYDVDGKLSELELAVGKASDEIKRLEDELRGKAPAPTEPEAPIEPVDQPAPTPEPEPEPEPEPAAPEAFGYTLKNSHPVSSLAAQFQVSPDDLMAANGWTNPNQQIPAGTTINVPDTPAARGMAAQYGGRVSEPVPVAEPAAPGAPRTDGTIGVPGDPNDFHMTQFVHERFNNSPNAPWGSANCGPTSLAMSLKAVGLQPPGLTNPGDTEHWIDTTREAMGAMWDNRGQYGDSAYSNIGQVKVGAEASGATWEDVTFDTLDQALAEGKPVVAAGNPAVYNGDWQDRGISNSEYNGGHFITITGKDADGNYLINDPLSNVGSVAITPDEMAAYMGHFGAGSAVAISNPNAPAPQAPTEPAPVDDTPMTDTPAATGDTAKLLGAMTAEDIENVLTQRGSVLAGQGYGEIILNMERKYGVPAAQFLAQAVMESSLGNAGYTQPGFNIGNLRPGDSWTGPIVDGGSGQFRVYNSWEEGIEDYFKLLAGPIYAGKNLADQLWTYCPPWDGNDTQHYHNQIVALINQWTGIQM